MGRGSASVVSLPVPEALAEPTFEKIDPAIAHLRRFSQDSFLLETLNPATPTLITTPKELDSLIEEILALSPPTLALDCEIAGMELVPSKRFIPDGNGGEKEIEGDDLVGGNLRLIQLAIHSPSNNIAPKQWMVDCFKVDAKPLSSILSNRNIQKVIHYSDFEQSQLMEKLNLDEPIYPIYDTCRAWMSVQKFLREITPEQRKELGFENWQRYKNELRHICNHLLGFTLEKQERESDWALDPLSEQQLIYATLDVAVLLPLASRVRYVVRTLGLQKKVRSHIYRANQEVVAKILKDRQAA
jgi:hypothetical protein